MTTETDKTPSATEAFMEASKKLDEAREIWQKAKNVEDFLFAEFLRCSDESRRLYKIAAGQGND